ncbi:sigma-70 family RNA polymerase sigma factor [Arthrobacter dokdonensis]|uniref:sigma-70 family RNA polymerase sigma factor n=1 Tax=Arthrobacter dokdonellae TaxID=2211210 RepID=UPI000DE5A6FF|nr:sigma-70 family RNA polymerase sigma factor [Arthrobacter dokdonellae]
MQVLPRPAATERAPSPWCEIDESSTVLENRALIDLLCRIAEGENVAFEDFFVHTHKRVFAVIRRILVSTELSEDTSQEVYIQVWKAASRFNPARGSVMAWLLTIARRRAVDHVRAEQSRRDRQTRFVVGSHCVDHDVVAEAAAAILEVEDVNLHLLSLSTLQHTAIELAFFDGLTYAEVAIILNVPLPTVKSRIRDSLLKLRQAMTEPSSTPPSLVA